jgi:hypothetical protein
VQDGQRASQQSGQARTQISYDSLVGVAESEIVDHCFCLVQLCSLVDKVDCLTGWKLFRWMEDKDPLVDLSYEGTVIGCLQEVPVPATQDNQFLVLSRWLCEIPLD